MKKLICISLCVLVMETVPVVQAAGVLETHGGQLLQARHKPATTAVARRSAKKHLAAKPHKHAHKTAKRRLKHKSGHSV
jgi:hypothetical protein